MKGNSMPFSQRRRHGATRRARRRARSAMTLIEVVAGLVILGTILASLAIARGRFARQWAVADRKLEATKAVDAMIAGWMESNPPQVPLNREGVLPGVAKHVWRTRVLRDAGAEKVLANI